MVTFEDRRRHLPSDDPSWQESFFLGWADVASGCAGSHHISLRKAKGAHVWSWLLIDGKPAARVQQHDLPLPDADLTDITIGPLHFTAGKTLRDLTLDAEFDGVTLHLDFRAVCDPVEVKFDIDGVVLGERHYETAGFAVGNVERDGKRTAIDAAGWHDHSWGARHFSSNPSSRWLFGVFGDDLAVSAFHFVTPEGHSRFGWVYDGGRVFAIRDTRFDAVMAEDGVSPRSCRADIWTEGGRGYRIAGEAVATSLTGGEGWFGVDGVMRLESGGRLGQGFFEPAELKVLTAPMRTELGLPA